MRWMRAGELRQGLERVRFGVTAPQVGDDQTEIRITPAQFAHLPHVVGVAQAGRLGHVEGHPGVALVGHLQLMRRQVGEDAGLQVGIARFPVRADQRVIGLEADHAGGIQQRGDFLLRPVWSHHRQAVPAAGGAFPLKIGVLGVEVEVQVGHAEGQTGELPPRKDGAVAVFSRGGVDGFQEFVHPILAAHGVGHRHEPVGGFGHMGVGVDQSLGQPGIEVLLPAGAVDVGVVPHVIERLVHGWKTQARGREARYSR